MGYYIHYKQAIGEAQIHSGDCPHCRHGYVPDEDPRKKGKWLGPFASYHEAEHAAAETRAQVLDCVDCMP